MAIFNGRSAFHVCVTAALGLAGCMDAQETQSDSAQESQASEPERVIAASERQTRIAGRVGRNRQPTSASYGAWRTQYKAPPIRGPIPVTGRIVSSPALGSLESGRTYTLALSGRDFLDLTEGGGLDLSFDPSVVEVTDVSVDGSVWEFFTRGGEINNTSGTVTNIAFASFEGRKGDFAIASVRFQARADGDSILSVSESPINPFGSRGQRIRIEIESPRFGGERDGTDEPNGHSKTVEVSRGG